MSQNYYEYNGQKMTISEWAEYLGVSQSTMTARIKQYYPDKPEKVFCAKWDGLDKYEYNGQKMTVREWAEYLGISREAMYSRIKQYYPHSMEKIFTEARHHRDAEYYEYDGQKMTAKEWAQYLGISTVSMHKRIRKYYPHKLEKIFCEKEDTLTLSGRKYEYNGQNMTVGEWAEYLGISHQTMRKRIKQHYPHELKKVFTKSSITANDIYTASDLLPSSLGILLKSIDFITDNSVLLEIVKKVSSKIIL
jgi:DNA-binding Lrp family transcriptional regulator